MIDKACHQKTFQSKCLHLVVVVLKCRSFDRHVLKHGLDHGLWTMDCGLWTMDYGLWTMDCGLWTVL